MKLQTASAGTRFNPRRGWPFMLTALAACVACGSTSNDSDGTGGAGGAAGASGGAAGASGGAAGASGGAAGALSWQECFGADGQAVQWALSLCTGACEMVEHTIDCCGTVMLVGVDSSKKAAFDACEAAWTATLPGCGCDAGPTQIQQPAGGTVTDKSEASVGCINWSSSGGVCTTTKK